MVISAHHNEANNVLAYFLNQIAHRRIRFLKWAHLHRRLVGFSYRFNLNHYFDFFGKGGGGGIVISQKNINIAVVV